MIQSILNETTEKTEERRPGTPDKDRKHPSSPVGPKPALITRPRGISICVNESPKKPTI